MIITMPSGFAGEIRGMKVRELQQLADPSLARGGRALDVMLGVFTSITALGPYARRWSIGGKPSWDDVLQGDVFAALIDVRCATWGPDYSFRVRCHECKEGYDWGLDLRDLPRRPYPEETIASLVEGQNAFTTTGPGGEEIAFRVLYRSDEKTIDAKRRRNGGKFGLADALEARIIRVAGVKEGRARAWIENLEALDAKALGDAMQLVEGGVETDIETICTFCGWQQWVSLPFDQAFYSPPKKRPATETKEEKATQDETAPGTPIASS